VNVSYRCASIRRSRPAEAAKKEESTPSHWVARGIPLLLLSVGLAVRLYRIDSESMWFDEHFLYLNLKLHGQEGIFGFTREYRNEDVTIMPVYLWLQYYCARAFGLEALFLRLPSVVFGMAAAGLFYLFVKRLYGFHAACIALLFACLSNIHIYYGQEIRPYTLVFLLSVCSMDSFHRAQHGGSALWRGVYYATSGLLLLTHFFGAFLLAAQGVYLLIAQWRRPSRVFLWAAGHAPSVLLVAWWMSSLDFVRLSKVTTADPMVNLLKVAARSFTWDACYLPRAIFQGELGLFLPVLALSGLAWGTFRAFPAQAGAVRGNGAPRQNFWFVLCWFIIPPLVLLLVCCARSMVFNSRYVLYSSFALFAIAGAALSALKPVWLRHIATAGLTVLLAWHCFSEYRPFRPADTEYAQWILAHKSPSDRVLRSPPWTILSFLPRLYPGLNLDGGHFDIVPFWVTPKEGETLWVIYSRPGWESELVKHEQTLRERNLEFERVKTTLSSCTFVYTALSLYRLDPYVTVLYRVWLRGPDRQ